MDQKIDYHESGIKKWSSKVIGHQMFKFTKDQLRGKKWLREEKENRDSSTVSTFCFQAPSPWLESFYTSDTYV